MTRDPAGYGGGVDLYSYTQNNPVNESDPDGTSALGDWYWGGMGGLSSWVSTNLLNGSDTNLGTVTGEHDAGCASGGAVALAGLGFVGNLALNAIPGGGEARGAEVAAHVAEEGIYEVVTASGERYIGQSGNITRRLAEHVAAKKFAAEDIANVIRTEVQGGKDAREIAEQLKIDSYGIENLLNKVNPVGLKRIGLMGPGYVRP